MVEATATGNDENGNKDSKSGETPTQTDPKGETHGMETKLEGNEKGGNYRGNEGGSINPRVEERINYLEMQINKIGESFETGFNEINGMISAGVKASAQQPAQANTRNVQANPATVETAEVEESEPIDPSMDLETENPLDNLSQETVELEGSIISRKWVGFTPKNLMLFDMARHRGFPGNFADFVNASIDSAYKSRSFKLVVKDAVRARGSISLCNA